MGKCVIGENYTFTVLFVDDLGDPFVPDTITIEIFYFASNGTKTNIVNAGTNMDTVPAETGRYKYTFQVPVAITPANQIFAVMTGEVTASGLSVVVEDTADPFEAGEGSIVIEDEGSNVGAFTILNFIGADVFVEDGTTKANIYIPPPPPPTFQSHWNTSDGSNGNQAVSDGVSRTTARISTPSGGEGTPFKTGGWAGSNRSSTLGTSTTMTTPSTTTGWGGDSYYVVNVFDADEVTVLETYTSPAITGNFSNTTGNITSSIANFAVDPGNGIIPDKNKAKLSVTVSLATLLPNGGKYNCQVIMYTDSTSDGTGPYTFTQTPVFIDANPSSPTLSGTLTFAENLPVVRQISGVSYYNTGSSFSVGVTGIDNLNANTARTSGNLSISASGYPLSTISSAPFSGSGWSGWTNNDNNTGAAYSNNSWQITATGQRYFSSTARVTAVARDPWATSASLQSPMTNIIVDTVSGNSTATAEYFNDEAYRQDSTYNGANPAGNWNSSKTLVSGEGLVFNSALQIPSSANISDFSAYNPSGSPNYAALTAASSYYRTIVDSSGLEQTTLNISFSGNFVSNATNDLANEHFRVFIRRRNSTSVAANTGTTSPPLRVHGSLYDFNNFDDGATVLGSYIRRASSSGNNVSATFGGALFNCTDGVYLQIEVVNPVVKIYSVSFSFG